MAEFAEFGIGPRSRGEIGVWFWRDTRLAAHRHRTKPRMGITYRGALTLAFSPCPSAAHHTYRTTVTKTENLPAGPNPRAARGAHRTGHCSDTRVQLTVSLRRPPRVFRRAFRGANMKSRRRGAGALAASPGIERETISHSTSSVSRIQIKAPGLLSRNSRMSEPAIRKILPSVCAQKVSRCGLRCSRE